jgi:four helix bundle protein
MNYPLEERTLSFAKDILSLCKTIKTTSLNDNIKKQLIRSGTSVGANYCEANGASSKSDFRNKIHICKKEAQETRYWLKLLEGIEPEHKKQIDTLTQEAHELSMIFGKIAATTAAFKT